MLSSLGFIGSSSRVVVPDITNLSISNATTALSYVGLSIGSSTGSTTSGATSGNNGNIALQDPVFGSDVERGSAINYITYNYIPPCSPNWTVQTIYSNCVSCVRYSNDYHTDGCGNSYFDNPQGPLPCDSGEETLTNEYDDMIGMTSTECNYRKTREYTNNCTGAVRYVYSYFTRARACPTCACPL